MPEVELTIRWADGTAQSGRSPSCAIERWIVERAVYPRDELVRRLQHGLDEASERVRQRYGYGCTVAAQQCEALVAGAVRHGGSPAAPALVERLRQLPPPISYPPPARMASHVDVVVVGGGQAGLAVSWSLRQRGIEHLVLERNRIASSWRDQRWDTFCLVTPNWQCRLPGREYSGPDPNGFMGREEIIEYVESFAASFRPPLHEGVAVNQIARAGRSGFVLQTSEGELRANQVVLAVGGYHELAIPALASRLPAEVTQLAARGCGARCRQRPVRGPDRRGFAAGRPRGAPMRRVGAAGGALLSWPGLRGVVGGHRPLRHADRRSSPGSRRPPRAQPLRHRARRGA
jgi:putative flavoprotein involved in K+ transport